MAVSGKDAIPSVTKLHLSLHQDLNSSSVPFNSVLFITRGFLWMDFYSLLYELQIRIASIDQLLKAYTCTHRPFKLGIDFWSSMKIVNRPPRRVNELAYNSFLSRFISFLLSFTFSCRRPEARSQSSPTRREAFEYKPEKIPGARSTGHS